MTISINRLELKARDKTDILIILEDEEKGYVEETLPVYHRLLFNDELVKELLVAERAEGAELPLVTRHLLLIDAQCMKTTDEEGKWARWTPETLAALGVPLQTEIHQQVFAPLLEVLRKVRPVAPAKMPAPSDIVEQESEEVLQL
jgi:nicotinamide mononucleotide adenylyltransferase